MDDAGGIQPPAHIFPRHFHFSSLTTLSNLVAGKADTLCSVQGVTPLKIECDVSYVALGIHSHHDAL